ncbi:M48 family metalloprotease [Herbidospora sp. NEAU-GS84]|uniref:M48 family metalloprotease n=1 Tax=Herbidospora solisilvae TaxID=2696284 RepID=A0A7C9JB59_9ACTN|nr:M48 family metallopeptidase [Herbidospora solisilvae]NAS25408.1 M48 family metalloprotease [Herbidospora solisilvae]
MGRALVSIVMLCGLVGVAAAQLTGFVVLLRAIPPGRVSPVGFVILVLVMFGWAGCLVWALGGGLWRALRWRDDRSTGPALDADQAPGLWELAREVAAEAGTRPPHEIRLMPEIDFRYAHTFLRGRRTLFIGLPLFQTMTVGQVRFGLAHHMEHFAAGHTRWFAVAHRCRVAITGTAETLGPTNPAGWAFRAYALLYVVIDRVACRRWEFRADAVGVRVAGSADAIDAMHEVWAVSDAWNFFHDFHLQPGLEAGYLPDDLFGGFAEFVVAREDEVDALRAKPLPANTSRWDPHPSSATRAARFAQSLVVPDGRPATSLILDLAAAQAALRATELEVTRAALRALGRELEDGMVLDWPEFTHAATAARLQREADAILQTIGLTGPGLPQVLRMLEDGRLDDLARPLFPEAAPGELPDLFLTPLEMLLNLAAVHAGQATFRHSWSEPAELVTSDGGPFDLTKVAEQAITDPRGATAELAALGIGIWRA